MRLTDDVCPPKVDRDIVSCVSGFRSSLLATSDVMKESWEPSSNRILALMWLLWLPTEATAVFSRTGVCLPESLIWQDGTEGAAVLSVVGPPEILFILANSFDDTRRGGSKFWQRLVWYFRWHTLHRLFDDLDLDTEWRLRHLKHTLSSRTMEYLFPLSFTTLQWFGLCSPLQKRHVRLVGRCSVGGGSTGCFIVVRNAAVATVVELLLSS